jgi:hypothetical protein
MHIMSGQDRSAAAAHETIDLLRRVKTLAVQQTPVRYYRTSDIRVIITAYQTEKSAMITRISGVVRVMFVKEPVLQRGQ